MAREDRADTLVLIGGQDRLVEEEMEGEGNLATEQS